MRVTPAMNSAMHRYLKNDAMLKPRLFSTLRRLHHENPLVGPTAPIRVIELTGLHRVFRGPARLRKCRACSEDSRRGEALKA
jgi:hypothetical protein